MIDGNMIWYQERLCIAVNALLNQRKYEQFQVTCPETTQALQHHRLTSPQKEIWRIEMDRGMR